MGEVDNTQDNMEKVSVKFDTGKHRVSLVPPEAVLSTARVFTFGAHKYGANNWKLDMKKQEWRDRILDAALRHIMVYNTGEIYDPESGLSHISHALANLSMLEYAIYNNIGDCGV